MQRDLSLCISRKGGKEKDERQPRVPDFHVRSNVRNVPFPQQEGDSRDIVDRSFEISKTFRELAGARST
jgi:hypothetical protein